MADYTLLHGDCLEAMAAMDAGSVDAVVTDPPYHLISSPARKSGFMGKTWDGGYVANDPLTWQTALRVIKPSHYLLAFGGTRTWHRLACAIEDAGFEIRDTLMWLYGSGFPKGKSCLKPAWEPIILARKPGPMRELGIDSCRISAQPGDYDHKPFVGPGNNGDLYGDYDHNEMPPPNPSGRWPANLILDEEAGAMLDGQTGTKKSGSRVAGVRTGLGYHGADGDGGPAIVGDSGGASRFFYCAKASRSERNAGCEGMEERLPAALSLAQDGGTFAAGNPEKPRNPRRTQQNHHPTVKPLALMRWLVKLVARPGDVVLDPFMGSGTTGVACAEEGREFIGIEREAEYIEIARRRIDHASAQGRLPLDESPPLPPVAGRPI